MLKKIQASDPKVFEDCKRKLGTIGSLVCHYTVRFENGGDVNKIQCSMVEDVILDSTYGKMIKLKGKNEYRVGAHYRVIG